MIRNKPFFAVLACLLLIPFSLLRGIGPQLDLSSAPAEAVRELFRQLSLPSELAQSLLQAREEGRLQSYADMVKLGFMPSEIEAVRGCTYFNPVDDSQVSDEASEEPVSLELAVHPLAINRATRTALLALPGMTAQAADIILNTRRQNPYRSWQELTNTGLTLSEIKPMINWLSFDTTDSGPFQGLAGYSAGSDFDTPRKAYPAAVQSFRLLGSAGYAEAYYATTWMDGGIFTRPSVEWLDSSVFYAQVDTGTVRVVAGDYQLRLGQGLVWGSAFAPPPASFGSAPFFKSQSGLSPRRSLSADSDANHYHDALRGLALNIAPTAFSLGGWMPGPQLLAFYSQRPENLQSKLKAETLYGLGLQCDTLLPVLSAGADVAFTENAAGTNAMGSLYYTLYFPAQLKAAAEVALTPGLAAVQSVRATPGDWDFLLTVYAADTNARASHGGDIIRSRSNTRGGYLGASYTRWGMTARLAADLETSYTNWSFDQRYEAALEGVLHPVLFVSTLEWNLKTRYTQHPDESDLRSSAALTLRFWQNRLSANLRYQNLTIPATGESGHLGCARLSLKLSWVYLYLRMNLYGSPSYDSALFSNEETLALGGGGIASYYGQGTEYLGGIRAEWYETLTATLQAGQDSRLYKGLWKTELKVQASVSLSLD